MKEFIARKSSNPVSSGEYELVSRNRMMPVMVRDGQVYQGNVLIGNFKNASSSNADTYEFSLPTGLIVARVTFTGGNNAQNASVVLTKDKLSRTASIPSQGTYGKTILKSKGVDRNYIVLKRIADWLVTNKYL